MVAYVNILLLLLLSLLLLYNEIYFCKLFHQIFNNALLGLPRENEADGLPRGSSRQLDVNATVKKMQSWRVRKQTGASEAFCEEVSE